MRRLRPVALLSVLATAVIVAPASAAQLALTPVAGVQFPNRSYVLSSSAPVPSTSIQITENGAPVNNVSVVAPNASQFGTVLLIANGQTMRGARIQDALQAAQTFVNARDPKQPVGIIYFNNATTVASPMTTDPTQLNSALAALPVLGTGRRIFDGAAAALQMLRASGVQHGTIILLSDGQDTGSTTTLQQVAGAASAQGARFYAIGVLAPVQGNALHTLAGATGGIYATVASQNLGALYQQIANVLSHQYTITYQSTQSLGQPVLVKALTPAGAATTAYVAPTAAAFPTVPGASPPGSSFVTSNGFALLVVVMGAALVGLAVFALTKQRQGVGARVSGFVSPHVASVAEAQRSLFERALGDSRSRAIGRSPLWTKLEEELDIARFEVTPAQVIVGGAIATVLLAFVLAELTRSPIAVLLALIVPFAIYFGIRTAADRQRRMFDEQLPDNLQVVASSMRAGNTFIGALNVVVEDAPEPSQRELRRALTDEQLGIPLSDALEGVTKRMKSDDFLHVAVVATLQRETGGNTAEVIDLVTDTVRERLELRRMVRALTAQGRLSAMVLTFLPPAVLIIILLINPHYMHPLFHTTGGIVALCIGAVMAIAGSYIINRIVDIEI
jgi:tight adherence protein B